jgi:hypothetical protein
MRALSLLLVMALVALGCAGPASKEHSKGQRETLAQLGISPDELAEIGQLAVADGRLVVVGMMKKEEGVIEVYLGDSVESHDGPLVRVHKINGEWLRIEDGRNAIWQK